MPKNLIRQSIHSALLDTKGIPLVTLFPLYLALTLSVLILIVYRFFVYPHDDSRNIGLMDFRPYDSNGRLLSSEENAFLSALSAVTHGKYTVHAKVSLASIIRPRGSTATSGRTWAWEFSHFQPVEFLLCDAETSSVV